MARIVGLGKAKEMIYTARGNYTAQQALEMGLVNYVYPLENLMDEAMKLAEEIAAQAPIAVALCKEAINVGMQTDLNSALKLTSLTRTRKSLLRNLRISKPFFVDC